MRKLVVPLVVALVTPVGSAFADPTGTKPEGPAGARAPTQAEVTRALGAAPPRAAVILDARTGQVLWGRRDSERLPPASLLKMVTALVAAEHLRPDDIVRISGRAARAEHDRVRWREGASFTADEVMHGMMLESSNGAAIAIAERVAGSVEEFAQMARARLQALGATDTVLVDPSGLDARGQHSTARDMALVAAETLRHPWLARIVKVKSFSLAWPDGGRATFRNINQYLERDPTAVGVKNGFTTSAGNTLAAAATRNARTHIVVAFSSTDIYAVTRRLMDLAFELAPPLSNEAMLEAAGRSGELALIARGPSAGTVVEELAPTEGEVPGAPLGEGRSSRAKALALALFAPYALYVFSKRKRQQRALGRLRARPPAPAAEPTAEIIEYQLVEWVPVYDENDARPSRTRVGS